MNGLKRLYLDYRILHKQRVKNAAYQIQFYGFWKQEITDMWFYRFVQSRQLLKDSSKRICFFSTFIGRDAIDKVDGDVKVFYTGENLKRGPYKTFADHLLSNKQLDFALGFEFFEYSRYLRFPLWLLYMFEPESTEKDIVRRCAELDRPIMGNRKKFACHISAADETGVRKGMCLGVSKVGQVDCAGKLLHNCDDLWNVYGDDKKSFMMNYRYNLCPENSNAAGYVTEKLFQSIDAGCVPVYWGDYNRPELDVLNQDAILFWKKGGDNAELLEFVQRLEEKPSMYEDFFHQHRLKSTAAEYVIERFNLLELMLKKYL